MRNAFTLIELMIVIAIIAIIAAIAIPNLLESRITANEAAASASMKAAIFAGEVQFQGGAYQDADQNGVGEYGPLDCMNGRKATSKTPLGTLKLLTGQMGVAVTNGYISNANYFFVSQCTSNTTIATQATTAIWTEATAAAPGAGGVTIALPVAAPTVSAQNGERYFCVGCAPASYGNTGRRCFMVSNDGQVRSPATVAADTIWLGAAPANNVIPTSASVIAGLANAYAGTWPTGMDNGRAPTYPVYSK